MKLFRCFRFTTFNAMKDTRWQASIMFCNLCNRRWAAAHPVQCEYLQCPACGHMNPAPAAPLLEDERPDFERISKLDLIGGGFFLIGIGFLVYLIFRN